MTTKTDEYRDSKIILIKLRRVARVQIEVKDLCLHLWNTKRREQAKLKQQGITFLPLEKEVRDYRTALDGVHQEIVDMGEVMFLLLDEWKEAGATLKELCDLCSVPYERAAREIGPDRTNEPFSGLMFVHKLDYQHDFSNCGFYRDEVDAPFSYCIKEYMLHLMLTDPVAKAASDIAFQECFPELAEKMFTISTNAEGETIYLDRDGMEIDPQELI